MDIIEIDKKNGDDYIGDFWNKKYGLGLYFSALHEKGIHILIDIFLIKNNTKKCYRTYHALHDGLSALKILNTEQKLDFSIPQTSIIPVKNKMKAILSALRSKPSHKFHFREQTPYSDTTDGNFYTLLCEPKKTSEYLNIIAHTLNRHFVDAKSTRWMIPCSTSNDIGLHASYLGLEVGHDEDVATTHQNFKNKLISGEHWGFYYLAKFALFFGKTGVRLGTKKTLSQKSSLWFGSLSNMGDLGMSHECDHMIVHHPLRWHRPIGIASYKFNNRNYVVVGLHKSLEKYPQDEIIQDLKTKLQGELLERN